MQTCNQCNGKGKYFGLGMIEHKCSGCYGTGKIEEEENKEVESVISNEKVFNSQEMLTRSEKMKAAWARRKAKENNK